MSGLNKTDRELLQQAYGAFYTMPPKKEWVGLTDKEKKSIFDSCEREDRGYVAAMVEAKLKDKNAA